MMTMHFSTECTINKLRLCQFQRVFTLLIKEPNTEHIYLKSLSFLEHYYFPLCASVCVCVGMTDHWDQPADFVWNSAALTSPVSKGGGLADQMCLCISTSLAVWRDSYCVVVCVSVRVCVKAWNACKCLIILSLLMWTWFTEGMRDWGFSRCRSWGADCGGWCDLLGQWGWLCFRPVKVILLELRDRGGRTAHMSFFWTLHKMNRWNNVIELLLGQFLFHLFAETPFKSLCCDFNSFYQSVELFLDTTVCWCYV